MTPAEAQVLLTMAATVDNRKPDPDAAKAWAVMLDGLGFEDCRLAVIEHYRSNNDWLMPAAIRAAVLRIRKERRLAYSRDHGHLLPPPGLSDADERDWLREAWRRISNGEHIDTSGAYGELVPAPEGLRELLPAEDTNRAARAASKEAP